MNLVRLATIRFHFPVSWDFRDSFTQRKKGNRLARFPFIDQYDGLVAGAGFEPATFGL